VRGASCYSLSTTQDEEKPMRGRQFLAAVGLSLILAARCATDTPPTNTPDHASSSTARAPRALPPVSAETVARIEADLVPIPAGTLAAGFRSRKSYETLKKDPPVPIQSFWLSKHEVTQEEWVAVMGNNPSQRQDDPRLPVTDISWPEAIKFVQRLNESKGITAFRLATAEEWEYACRAGEVGHVRAQANEATLNQYAWWGKNSGEHSHAVATRKPNAFGLFDMLGNVAEWCQTESDTKSDPPLRVIAGANFADENLVGQDCHPGGAMGQNGRDAYTGFRLAKNGPTPAAKGKAK